jgi:predicted nucleic acid-binding protein
MGARDAFIAATAEVHGLILLTRDASDFAAIVNDILTPWNERESVIARRSERLMAAGP